MIDYGSWRAPGEDWAQREFNRIMDSADGGSAVAYNFMMSHFQDSDWRRLLAEAGAGDEIHSLINHFAQGGYPEWDHLGGRSPMAYYRWTLRHGAQAPQVIAEPEQEPPTLLQPDGTQPPLEQTRTLMERVAALEARVAALERR